MSRTPAIAIFDVGKTNKKILVFDQRYNVVHEESKNFDEITDEDGFPCEDVQALAAWVKESYRRLLDDRRFNVRAVNFSAYGASLVYLDKDGGLLAPLYNYLKPFPKKLSDPFYKTYGGESHVAKQTASPVLGSLNSGMQLYRLKREQPELFEKIKYALHLPQFLSFLITAVPCADITSIGCHTGLWDYQHQRYHKWVKQEGLLDKFAPIHSCQEIVSTTGDGVLVGTGLHDSSAALIPYLSTYRDPFILLSTGTWCISLNPFNHSLLSNYELDHDCLCYLSYEGHAIKASRLFAGYEHEQQVKKLAEQFNVGGDHYKSVQPDPVLLSRSKLRIREQLTKKEDTAMVGQSAFEKRKLTDFESYEEAYHQLIADIITQQVRSTNIVLKGTAVKRIFVDGGFGKNPVYMALLALSFPGIEVYAASVAQASALGAALAIHKKWNPGPLPAGLARLKYYKLGESMNSFA